MKKICIIILCVLLCINFTACSDSTSNNNDGDNSTPVENPENSQKNNSQSNVLTIAVFHLEDDLETIAQKFQDHNPGITVKIKEYGHVIEEIIELENGATLGSTEIDPEEYEKYRQTINTELMSGKAPDIIGLEKLPYKNYIDNGMLADIGELMKSDTTFDVNNYNTNIFEGLKYKDKLYTIPQCYCIPTIITGNYNLKLQDTDNKIDDSTWKWEDFFSSTQKMLKEKNEKPEYVLDTTKDMLFEQMFIDIYNNIVNEEEKTADFTSKQFIDAMEYCENLSDNKLIYKNGEDWRKNNNNKIIFSPFFLWSLYDMLTASYSIDNDGNISDNYFYKMPSNNKTDNMFSCYNMFSINNNSNNKDLAWKFIKFLISDEIQSSPQTYYFPINKTALNKKIEKESQLYINGCKKHKEIPLDKADKLVEDYTQQFKEFISSAKTHCYANPEILNIVKEHVQMFFSGEKSSEQVAQIIQNKVSTYLSEQK